MTRPVTVASAVALLALVVALCPAHAQTASAKHTGPLAYNVGAEVTLSATVKTIAANTSTGMFLGPRVVLETNTGTVNASLGRFALRSPNGLPLKPGDHLQVTGVPATFKNKSVFLIRTIQLHGHVYTIRNAHGFPLLRPLVDSQLQSSSRRGAL